MTMRFKVVYSFASHHIQRCRTRLTMTTFALTEDFKIRSLDEGDTDRGILGEAHGLHRSMP